MRCDREPHIHPGAIQVDSLAPAHLTLRATLRQPPERLPRRLGHRRVDIPCTARKLHNLIELPRDLVCSHPGSQSPAGLPAAPVNLHRPRCCARWANLRLLFLRASQPSGSRPVNSGWNPVPTSSNEAILPLTLICPELCVVTRERILSKVELIRAFPRRLTLRAALRQSPVQPPGCLGPSGYPAAWLPAPFRPMMANS